MAIEPKDELLQDAVALLLRIKGDRRVWSGDVGLSPTQREDVNDALSRYDSLKKEGAVP